MSKYVLELKNYAIDIPYMGFTHDAREPLVQRVFMLARVVDSHEQ